jgi:hypothetical protein
MPARHDRWFHRDTGMKVDRTGHAYTDASRSIHTLGSKELAHELEDTAEDTFWPGAYIGFLGQLRKDAESPVRNGHIQRRGTDVDTDEP